MTVKLVFGRLYKVVFPTRDDWRYSPDPGGGREMWFTDGSKINDDNGAGVYCPIGTEESYPLGKHATVFQAEVYAILKCCGICLREERRGKRICICSDSRATLLALQSPKVTSRMVWEGRERLCDLAEDNGVELRWVPGYSGILGNEAADRLTREGFSATLVGAGALSWYPWQSCQGGGVCRCW